MKKIAIFALSFLVFSAFSVPFSSLDDSFVVATVGRTDITVTDMKMYMAGIKSITNWDASAIKQVVDSLITDMVFMNACIDEKITVQQEEAYWYAEYYFNKIGIDINNPEQVQKYFDTNDPYADMDDFLTKSIFFLLKSKYLLQHGIITNVKASQIFFPVNNKKETKNIESKARQITNSLYSDDIPFTQIFSYYSNNKFSGDMGELNIQGSHKFIPKSEMKRVFNNGMFAPTFVKNKEGFSIVFITTYALTNTKQMETLLNSLFTKYPPKINISF